MAEKEKMPWEEEYASPEAEKMPWEEQYAAAPKAEEKPPVKEPSALATTAQRWMERAKLASKAATGIGEAGLSAVTGAAGQVAGGVRGLYGLASGETGAEAAEAVRRTEEGLTYQPRTVAGQKIAETMAIPMEEATKYAGKAGAAIGEAVGGEKGRLIGESLGEVTPQVAAAALPFKGVFRSAGEIAKAAKSTKVPTKRDLTPEQQERFDRQKSQGLEPTLGSVTREPEQFRFESQLAQMTETHAGKVLRARQVANEQAIQKAIKDIDQDITKQKGIKPRAYDQLQTGQSIVGALQKKEAAAWKTVTDLYDRAKNAGETNMVVDTGALDNWLNKNRAEAHTVPALKSISDKLDSLKKEFNGNVTLGDLEELYKSANRLSKPGDPSGFYMRTVKDLINQVTAGKGGDLYREARRARLNYGREFEQQKAIADLIGTKRGYPADPRVAAENIFDRTILSKSSSLQDLQNIKRTLLSGELKDFPEGPQALREMQSQTINHLLEKSNAGDLDSPRLSDAALRREINKIGKNKLNELLGKDAVDKLMAAVKSLQETQRQPGRVIGSDTYLKAKIEKNKNLVSNMAAEHMVSELPLYLKLPAKAALKVREKVTRAKSLQEAAEEALSPERVSPEEVSKLEMKRRAAMGRIALSEAAKRSAMAVPTGTTMPPEETQQPPL